MIGKRITMADVASRLGVHQTTVSLALRNHPSLPEATRKRIAEAAEKLGYRRDPALDALNAYRHGDRSLRRHTLAYVTDFRSASEFEACSPPTRHLHEGAAEQAARFGFHLETFYFDPAAPDRSSRTLGRILRARGIDGLIIGAFRTSSSLIQLRWEEFCCVQIESRHLGLPFSAVSVDQTHIVRTVVRQLLRRGYTRLGLLFGRLEEAYLDNAFRVGFYGETALHPEIEKHVELPLENHAPIDFSQVKAWIRKHRLDALISNWNTLAKDLRNQGLKIPGDIAFASADLNSDFPEVAGVMAHQKAVGAKAVEQLAILLKLNERGAQSLRTELLVDGAWVDGATAPSKI